MIHTKMSSPVSEKDMTVPKGGKEMGGGHIHWEVNVSCNVTSSSVISTLGQRLNVTFP